MSDDGFTMHTDTGGIRNVTLEGGRERQHPSGAAAAFAIIGLLGLGVGFLAGWITGTWL